MSLISADGKSLAKRAQTLALPVVVFPLAKLLQPTQILLGNLPSCKALVVTICYTFPTKEIPLEILPSWITSGGESFPSGVY